MEHFSRIVTQYLELVSDMSLRNIDTDEQAQKARSRLLRRMIKVCACPRWLPYPMQHDST